MPSLRLWYRRRRLLWYYCRGLRIRRFRRAWYELFAIGCTDPEEEQVSECLNRHGDEMLVRMENWTQSHRNFAPLWIWCVGRDVRRPLVPTGSDHLGVWLRANQTAVAYLDPAVSIERIVAHEAGHALLDLLTVGFPFPRAIQEGVASVCEYYFGGWREDRQRNASSAADRRDGVWMDPAYHRPIRELLMFDPRVPNERLPIGLMTVLSGWMMHFLVGLAKSRAQVIGILQAPRMLNLNTPEKLYGWLLEVTGFSAADLELRFFEYCTGPSSGEGEASCS